MTIVCKKESFLRGRSKEEFVEILKKYFNSKASEVYIFGSFYTKEFNADSDLDILIVTSTDLKFHERFQLFPELTNFLNQENAEFDLIVYTPQEFQKLIQEGSNSKTGFWCDFTKTAKKII